MVQHLTHIWVCRPAVDVQFRREIQGDDNKPASCCHVCPGEVELVFYLLRFRPDARLEFRSHEVMEALLEALEDVEALVAAHNAAVAMMVTLNRILPHLFIEFAVLWLGFLSSAAECGARVQLDTHEPPRGRGHWFDSGSAHSSLCSLRLPLGPFRQYGGCGPACNGAGSPRRLRAACADRSEEPLWSVVNPWQALWTEVELDEYVHK